MSTAETDEITQQLIQNNIDTVFYSNIEANMKTRNCRHFQIPHIAELITFRTNQQRIYGQNQWVIKHSKKQITDSLITELYIQLQLGDNFNFKDFLFESAIMEHFNSNKGMISECPLDPAFYVISLDKVDIKNKEFNNMLRHVLKSRAYYNYPTLVLVNIKELECMKEGVLYYSFQEIQDLGYKDLTPLLVMCEKRKKFTGQQLNEVIMKNDK